MLVCGILLKGLFVGQRFLIIFLLKMVMTRDTQRCAWSASLNLIALMELLWVSNYFRFLLQLWGWRWGVHLLNALKQLVYIKGLLSKYNGWRMGLYFHLLVHFWVIMAGWRDNWLFVDILFEVFVIPLGVSIFVNIVVPAFNPQNFGIDLWRHSTPLNIIHTLVNCTHVKFNFNCWLRLFENCKSILL
jgi:hypothetical protein